MTPFMSSVRSIPASLMMSPMQNARKLFATRELERLSKDRDWLDDCREARRGRKQVSLIITGFVQMCLPRTL